MVEYNSLMPRQARIDSPGLLHHVIARGIERRAIFFDKRDYDDFLQRIETSLTKSPNQILAWALMPNHFHMLIRSGSGGLSRFMRRLMSGYAVAFNLRHRRSGYLFQNRYKSIVCEEEPYLLELVRYIHLNPLRAGLVKTVSELNGFPYSGHSAMMGEVPRSWQNREEIIERFGSKDRYESFIIEGKGQGRRPELVGGGLIRSMGGISAVLQSQREGDRQAYDSRVLGGGDFVERVMKEADIVLETRNVLTRKGYDLRSMARHIAESFGLEERDLFTKGRREALSRAKSALIFIGVEYFSKTTKEMAALTRMSLAGASKSREQGEVMAKDDPALLSLVS